MKKSEFKVEKTRDKLAEKNEIEVYGVNLVDWFLAIDGCFA